MAKKKKKPAVSGKQQKTVPEQKRNAPEQKPRAAAERTGGEKKRPYTLIDCMKIGRLGNILFIVFIIVCLIYYYSLARKGNYVIPFEVVAYGIEAAGFALFTTSIIWIDRLVRARVLMKVLLIVYIVVEVVLMLLEFQFLPWRFFRFFTYNGISRWTVIGHALFSAGISFSLLMLEPHNKRLEIIVGITTGIILSGMFLAVPGYRVYASILLNAGAYIFFFTALQRQLVLEEVLVDCYGDQAKAADFSSTLFADTPDLIEREKPTVKQRVKRIRNKLNLENQETMILTDKDEKFEYEFGTIEEDDDDDEDYEDDDE